MHKITSDSEIKEVMRTVGINNHRRKEDLEKFAQLRSRDPTVKLELSDTETAFVQIKEGEKGIEEFRNITVTNKEFDQHPDYKLPEKYHKYLIQKGFTAHEVGHILYSSYKSMKHYVDLVKDEDYNNAIIFKNLYNIMEDGAVEKFLSEDYYLEEELNHVRGSIHENQEMGLSYDGEKHYPFIHAVFTALMNMGVYDNGELEKLLDKDNEKYQIAKRGQKNDRELLIEILPELRKYTEKVQNEYDAEKRSQIIYEDVWPLVKEKIGQSRTSGKNRIQNGKKQKSYIKNGPEHMSEGHGSQQESPTGRNENDSTIADERKEINSEDIEEKTKEQLNKIARRNLEGMEEELQKVMKSLKGGEGVEEIYIPEDGKVNSRKLSEAKRVSRRCERIFKRVLQKKQRDRVIKDKRHGRFDSDRMIEAKRGSTYVYEEEIEGDKKDYSCVIVSDRSGSMRQNISSVEISAGAVAYGLESVGVDTCLMDTYKSKTTLAKPFQTDIKDFERKIFDGRCGGGTPLRYSLKFARERIQNGNGKVPFMIVITDGKPSSEKKTKEEIRKANFPVLGLYLNNNRENIEEQLQMYDRSVVVTEEDNVSGKLMNLINAVIFR